MAKNYPNIGWVKLRDKNTSAKCRCGELGKYKVDIQISYMRGDDLVVWACGEHRKDATYLAGTR